MPIDNATWHATVRSFYALEPLLQYKSKTRKVSFSFQTLYYSFLALSYTIKSNLNNVYYFFNCMVTKSMSSITLLPNIFFFICILNLLCRCGNIETNPGPRYSSLTFCHWNLNGHTAHDSTKISLLKPIFSSIIKTSYVYQKRFWNPSDSKRDGVCIYYKEHILHIKRDDICTLDSCLVREIRFKGENYILFCIYRSLSHDEFEFFCVNFHLLLNNINDKFLICFIVTGDFNARCSSWW